MAKTIKRPIVDNLIERRRDIVKELLQYGFSLYDIAYYFEVRPESIQKSIDNINWEDIVSEISPFHLDELIEKRNNILKEFPNEKTLFELGFVSVPFIKPVNVKIPDNIPEILYPMIINGLSKKELAAMLGISAVSLKREMLKCGLDESDIKYYAKQYKNDYYAQRIKQLRLIGFKKFEIAEYLLLTERKIEYLSSKEQKKYDESIIRLLIQNGVSIKELLELTNLRTDELTEIHKKYVSEIKQTHKKDTPFDFKTESRRKIVFELYDTGMTQQEVADELHLTRYTVITDLKKYQEDHPEIIDKTRLIRRRNSGELRTQERNLISEKILKLHHAGLTNMDISRETGIQAAMVSVYLDEAGKTTNYQPYHNRIEKRQIILHMLHEGKTNEEVVQFLEDPKRQSTQKISKAMKQINNALKMQEHIIVKAEELKMGWDKERTEDIAIRFGKSRKAVLADQHKNQNFLRNNPEALKYIEEHDGNVIKEAEEYAHF